MEKCCYAQVQNRFWLLIHDRVNSRNLLHRKSFHLPSYSYELCQSNTEETTLHLFWDCDFSLNSCNSIIGHRSRGISVFGEILLTIQALPAPIAMEVTIMGCWNIWMQRNGKIFKAQSASVHHGELYLTWICSCSDTESKPNLKLNYLIGLTSF